MPGMFSGYEAFNAEQAKQDSRRSEKAKAFREMVEANAAAGIDTDPAELDRVRMSMVGGDPYLASMIPPTEALKQMAESANQKAQNARMKTQTDRWAMQDTERNYVQRIIDDNWDKSPEDMSKIFETAFGNDAPRLYDQYKPQLPNMLSESTGKQYAKIKSNPASAYLYEPEDIDRLFPAEARSPAMRKVLDSVRQDNLRARNKGQFKDTMEILKETPEFVVNSPEGQKWWGNMSAQGMGYSDPSQVPNAQVFQQGQNLAISQAAATQQAKVTQLAAKDPYFAMAAQSGDEDSLFAATTSLMVQAGMPAPKDKTDPNYLTIKKSLELVSRTAAVAEYNKKEADLKTAAIEEAEAMTKGQKARMDAAASAAFLGHEFSNGKGGKDAGADERIGAALSLINNDPSFYGTPENIQAAVNFVKQGFLKDKKNFDPTAAYGEFMSKGNMETKAEWIKRRTDSQITGSGLLKPGTNFQAQMDNRKTQVTETVNMAFSALNKPAKTAAEYNTVMNNKAIIVQRLRAQLNEIRTSVNTLNNDPAVRGNVVGFDYRSSLRDMEILENSIQQIEKFNPVMPQDMMPNPPTPTAPNKQPAAPNQENSFWGGSNARGRAWSKSLGFDNSPLTPEEQPHAFHIPTHEEMRAWGRRNNQKFDESLGIAPRQETRTVYTPMAYETVMEVPATNVPRNRMDTYLDAIADIESSGNPFARAVNSSASGLYQFTRSTWNNLVQRYGQRYGITTQDIWNPAAQRIFANILTVENGNTLMARTGKEPNETDLYLAHFLGPNRAATVINHQGSSLLAANLFPDAAKANKGIFYKDGVPLTIEELYKTLGSKVKRRIKST